MAKAFKLFELLASKGKDYEAEELDRLHYSATGTTGGMFPYDQRAS